MVDVDGLTGLPSGSTLLFQMQINAKIFMHCRSESVHAAGCCAYVIDTMQIMINKCPVYSARLRLATE